MQNMNSQKNIGPRHYRATTLFAVTILVAGIWGASTATAADFDGKVLSVSDDLVFVAANPGVKSQNGNEVRVYENVASIGENVVVAKASVISQAGRVVTATLSQPTDRVQEGMAVKLIKKSSQSRQHVAAKQHSQSRIATFRLLDEGELSAPANRRAAKLIGRRAWLGLFSRKIIQGQAEEMGLQRREGLLVTGIIPDSPAAAADLRVDDLLLQLNDKPIQSQQQLISLVEAFLPGDRGTLKLLRNGQLGEIDVRFQQRPASDKFNQTLEQLAENGMVPAQLELARAFQNGRGRKADAEQAVYWFRKAAESGSALAALRLGWFSEQGRGVDKSDVEAARWYRVASRRGNVQAQHALGVMYYNGRGVSRDLKEATRWFSAAAKQGLAKSQYNLGYFCYTGQGVAQNDNAAYNLFSLAAAQGYAEAQNYVGLMKENGRGTTRNLQAAVSWYRKAAVGGSLHAQTNLGNMYFNGRGTNKSRKEAAKWFHRAAQAGHDRAQYNLGVLYATNSKPDYGKALALFRQAADQGYIEAINYIGTMYQNGQGVAKDDAAAVKWYHKAADRGLAAAQLNLANMCANGWGVRKNYRTARQWYELAAKQDNALAQNALGYLYDHGLGVTRNRSKALKYFHQAAKQGDPVAQNNMGLMAVKDGRKDYHVALAWFRLAVRQGYADAETNLGVMYQNGWGVPRNRAQAIAWYLKAVDHGSNTAKKNLANLNVKT